MKTIFVKVEVGLTEGEISTVRVTTEDNYLPLSNTLLCSDVTTLLSLRLRSFVLVNRSLRPNSCLFFFSVVRALKIIPLTQW